MAKSITAVECQIAALLKAYEEETGEVVKAISLRTIDMTDIDCSSRKFLQKVDIETERLPGNSWVF